MDLYQEFRKAIKPLVLVTDPDRRNRDEDEPDVQEEAERREGSGLPAPRIIFGGTAA